MNYRKTIRLASTPVTLIILLGLLAAGVVWGYKSVTAKIPGTQPAPCVTMPMTELTTASVTVNVYNAGTNVGLAGRIAASLQQGGFVIGKVGNSTDKVLTISIVGANTDDPEVQLVAAWFNNPEIQADNRPDHSVDVIVGSGYDEKTGPAPTPPTSTQIPSGQVCLPSPTPTPTPEPTPEPAPTDQPS